MKALLVTLAMLATAVVLSACGGSSGLIPTSDATQLQSDLNQVSDDVLLHDCGATGADLGLVQSDYRALPTSVDAALRANLAEGLAALDKAARHDCQNHSASTGATAATGTTSATGSTGTTGSTGSTSSTTSTTTSTSTATSTTTSTATTTSSAATSTNQSGATGPTEVPTTGTGGGTQAGGGTTSGTGASAPSGIGGSGGVASGN